MKQEINSEVEGGVAGRDIIHHEAPQHSTTINVGINTGQISHGDIHNWGPIILGGLSRPKVKVVLQPGPEHIDQKKAATLKSLVSEIVRLEKLVKRSPKSYAAVWTALTARCRVTSYHLILDVDYPKAEKFLREWIGRLSSAKSAHLKDGNWRNRKFSYIFANVKQLDADAILRAQLLERYGSESMKDLTDDELEALYRLVAGWKKAGHAPGQASPDRVPEGT